MMAGTMRDEEESRKFLVRLQWVEEGKKRVENKHATETQSHRTAGGKNKILGGKANNVQRQLKEMSVWKSGL
jgi:hypothetical protein